MYACVAKFIGQQTTQRVQAHRAIDPQRDRYMHSASLELLGPDEIRSEWTEHADGKSVLVARSHLVRKTR